MTPARYGAIIGGLRSEITRSPKGKGKHHVTETFRKHYSYGETIPILNTQVGMICDIFEAHGGQGGTKPYCKAVLVATAGPVKSLPMIVDPLANDSKIIHLTDIPVPIPRVRTVDLSLIFDVANYRWTPVPEAPRDGLVTFDLRCRAAFSMLSKSYTLLLDQRPCAITLTGQVSDYAQHQQQHAQQQMPFGPSQSEVGSVPYPRFEERPIGGYVPNGGGEPENVITQLDLEERLRQFGTRLLARS